MEANTLFGGLILFTMIGCVGILAANAIIPPIYTHLDEPIISMNDGSELSGSFVFGSGTIGEDPVFVFYKAKGQGYSLETRSARYATVIEDENNSPYLRTIFVQHFGGLPVWDSYEFHVPKGTIIRRMNLDSNLRT